MDNALIQILERDGETYPVRYYLNPSNAEGQPHGQSVDGTLARSAFSAEPDPEKKLRDRFLEAKGNQLELESIGTTLYDALRGTAAGKAWVERRSENNHLRTLLDIRAPELASLPWELMYSDEDLEWLQLTADKPVMRGRLWAAVPPECCPWPLRVQVVIGSQANDKKVKAEEEEEAIAASVYAFGALVEYLPPLLRPTETDLREAIRERRPQVFHFIGHGALETGAGRPALHFAPDGGSPWYWTALKVQQLLNGGWAPRLVFLNACRSADVPVEPSGERRTAASHAIAERFIKAGTPATLGMQRDVEGSFAGEFAAEFYRWLFPYYTGKRLLLAGPGAIGAGDADAMLLVLDRAVAEARQHALIKSPGGFANPDWATPLLHVNFPPEHVLPLRPSVEPTRWKAICADYERWRDFVGRARDRETLSRMLEPEGGGGAHQVIAVTGAPRCGKTALVRYCLERCALRGNRIFYLDLDDEHGTKDFLQVLKLLRQVIDPKGEEFLDFDREVRHRLTGIEPAASESLATTDRGWGDAPDKSDWVIDRLFQMFRVSLEKSFAVKPGLIVIDHLKLVTQPDRAQLGRGLIQPVAQGDRKHVRLVLISTDLEYQALRLPHTTPVFRMSPEEIPKVSFETLLRQLGRIARVDREDVDVIASIYANEAKVGPLPEFFSRVIPLELRRSVKIP